MKTLHEPPLLCTGELPRESFYRGWDHSSTRECLLREHEALDLVSCKYIDYKVKVLGTSIYDSLRISGDIVEEGVEGTEEPADGGGLFSGHIRLLGLRTHNGCGHLPKTCTRY